MDLKTLPDTLQKLAVSQKPKIIAIFCLFYALIVLLMLVGSYAVISQNALGDWFILIGNWFGKAALTVFCIVLLPGIALRFRKSNKITGIIMFYRRQLGISVYLLGLLHLSIVWLSPKIVDQTPVLSLRLFEYFGLAAMLLMLPMFLTSNNFSQQKLGKWWKRIHRIIYVVAWLLFIHVALQKSLWSILIGGMAVLEWSSLVYDFGRKRQKKISI